MNTRNYSSITATVRRIFSDHLENNGFRKTRERFSILEEIYKQEGHFEVEELYTRLKKRRFNVSRATVYNTVDLLVGCNLIKKHQFGKTSAQYERSFAFRQHDHLICSDCGKVLEFCDPRIQQIQEMVGGILGFQVSHHSLHLFGKCKSLQEDGKCANKPIAER